MRAELEENLFEGAEIDRVNLIGGRNRDHTYVGVSNTSLTYAAMASLPYWLPALAAGKRKRRRKKRTLTNEIILPQDYQTTLYVQQQKYL